MRIRVDSTLCQGHGLCYMNAPTLFTPDDEGHATTPDGDVAPADEPLAREAVDICPERAIKLVEHSGSAPG